MRRTRLTPDEARRIALAAQGFDRPRPARPDIRHIRRLMGHTRLIQIDFVNVLIPAHYLVPFARLGPYDRSRLDELVYRKQEWTEQWAHEASIIPVDMWPLLRDRMANHVPRPRGFVDFLNKHSQYVDEVMAQIRQDGPAAPEDLPAPAGVESRIAGAWIGTVQRAVLESLFGQGQIAAVGRRKNFTRVYDLTERVIPFKYLQNTLSGHDAHRELLRRAAAACGVATLADLADYFRMQIGTAKSRVEELVEEGTLHNVQIDGSGEAYLYRNARLPRNIAAKTLLSPFDPLVWFRPRLRRLFNFDYRLEIFMPAAKRKWGYYVMPFLMDEKLVARVDLKADRKNSRLQIIAAYSEPGALESKTTAALAVELDQMAEWLELESVSVGRRGNLARGLSRAVANRR
ncbi:MAG: winged helix DNA-binding domain-containing protein [Gammaproteobacteria bacterium]|nr:winged helix DNA-binding domain-containing protein [Gammaproteobacteria bacterium]MDH3768653.1 winged helix DNA-binding domain-containing protein [Gammaproteobacteria bacterium]